MAGKVLFVIERLRGGGAERALSNIVTHFPDDWHIDILIDDESLIEYPYRGNILSLSSPEKNSTIHFVKNMIKRAFYLKRLKKCNGYNACVSFLEGANISNVLSGNKYCRTIVSIRNQLMSEKTGLYFKIRDYILTKVLFSHADVITAVSKEIGKTLTNSLKINEDKIKVIENGYDCECIREEMVKYPQTGVKNKELVKEEGKIIVTVGRAVEQKGQWHLIRAFSEVVKEVPQAVLYIIGDGPLTGYLADLINIYNLNGHVILTGRCDNPFWYLAAADIFILPSLWEGYPNALAEAVCCGVPCIATDVHSGVREILAPALDVGGERVGEISEEEYGVLIPACSGKRYRENEPLESEENKMAEAIALLLENNEKRKHYRKESIKRSKDIDINLAVGKWIDVISV